MAEEIERYRAKVNFRHKFEDVKQQLDPNFNFRIWSPQFFARNIPFHLELFGDENGKLSCSLVCAEAESPHYSVNVEYQLSLITPSKSVQSEKISTIFHAECYHEGSALSKIFHGEEIIVDDAVTVEASLWAQEPEGTDFKPPKKKLRQELQVVESQVKSDAFASLLKSEDFSDVTFILNADSSKVKAHKNILASRSEVFARMLSTEMAEARDNEIKIEDMGAPALKIMLHHIYTGQLGFPKGIKVNLEICQELVNAGEKYGLQNLKEYAAMAMTEFVSLENAKELISFAKLFKAEAATKALTSYYAENVFKIIDKM